MKRKNKIDQFFENSLSKSDIPKKAWNTPDDFVWENILDKFENSKDEKKRFPLFLLIGISFLFVAILFFLVQKKSDNQILTDESIDSLNNAVNVVSSDSCKINEISRTNSYVSNLTIVEKSVSNTLFKGENTLHNSINNITSTNEILRVQSSNFTRDYKIPEPSNQNSSLANNEAIHQIDLASSEFHIYNKQVNNRRLLNDNNLNSKIYFQDSNLLIGDIIRPESGIVDINFLKSFLFPVLFDSTNESITTPNHNFTNSQTMDIIKNDWAWEVGISHSRYIVNPFTKVEAKDLQRNEYLELLSSSYKNVNMQIANRVSNDWVFQTGLYYTQQKINVGFELRNLVYTESTDPALYFSTIAKRFSDYVSNENDENLELVFLPTANLSDGDTMQLVGQLPVKLDAFQVPFSIKYELEKSKWRYSCAGGFSLNLFNIKVNSLPVEVFAKDVLVSNDVGFTSFSKTLINFNIHLDFGVRYFVSKNVNIGLAYRFEPFSNEFSRYQFGVFYRN